MWEIYNKTQNAYYVHSLKEDTFPSTIQETKLYRLLSHYTYRPTKSSLTLPFLMFFSFGNSIKYSQISKNKLLLTISLLSIF